MQIDTVTFTFTGHLPVTSFAEFAQHRAARLSIDLASVCESEDLFTLRVHGPRDLVDAFEMAMSLGPQDCLVLDVIRTDNDDNRSEPQ